MNNLGHIAYHTVSITNCLLWELKNETTFYGNNIQ